MHNSQKRFRIAAFGRQSGKSTWAINEILHQAWTHPYTNNWFIAPTYDQALVIYRRMKYQLMNCRGCLEKKPNDSELRFDFINGSFIQFKSGHNFDSLRVETLHFVIIDEVRDQSKDLWPMIIRPMLTTTMGRAGFISTPAGFDHFYDLFEEARANPFEWDHFQAPSTVNPLITHKEMEAARRFVTEAQYRQEYLAEFCDITADKVYINHGTHNHMLHSPFCHTNLIHPLLPVIIGMDFNISPMAWTLGQKRGDIFYWFDELHIESANTQIAAEVLAQKVKALNLKHGAVIVGDATGRASQRAAHGQSDYDIVCQALDRAGIPWQNLTPQSNPPVMDRINTVNAKLLNAAGEASLYYHPINCPYLKKDFERVTWKKTSTSSAILDQSSDPMLTHHSDSVGYAVCALSPLIYQASMPILKVITRRT
jgi:hypothetical protein